VATKGELTGRRNPWSRSGNPRPLLLPPKGGGARTPLAFSPKGVGACAPPPCSQSTEGAHAPPLPSVQKRGRLRPFPCFQSKGGAPVRVRVRVSTFSVVSIDFSQGRTVDTCALGAHAESDMRKLPRTLCQVFLVNFPDLVNY
jgi:hypothetical protein